jgi:hypothetical protein
MSLQSCASNRLKFLERQLALARVWEGTDGNDENRGLTILIWPPEKRIWVRVGSSPHPLHMHTYRSIVPRYRAIKRQKGSASVTGQNADPIGDYE